MADRKVRVNDLRDSDFNISLNGAARRTDGGHFMASEQWQLVIQVRILRELEKLNALLACPNFTGIPQSLRDIKRHTGRLPTIARPRKRKAKTA
jgi:hypothetical protein